MVFSACEPIGGQVLGKSKTYRYIVDNLTTESAEIISKSLRAVPEIKGIAVHPNRGTVEILARRDMEEQVRMACDIARVQFRIKVTE
jgi:hypothetical protein